MAVIDSGRIDHLTDPIGARPAGHEIAEDERRRAEGEHRRALRADAAATLTRTKADGGSKPFRCRW
jgi:hypothetical protein